MIRLDTIRQDQGNPSCRFGSRVLLALARAIALVRDVDASFRISDVWPLFSSQDHRPGHLVGF